MRRTASALTGVAPGREIDEDCYDFVPEHDLYIVVAGGLGGDRAVASRLAADAIADGFPITLDPDWPFPGDAELSAEEHALHTSLRVANRRLFDHKRREGVALAATAVSACYEPQANRLSLGRVGNGCGYRVRGGSIQLLTRGVGHASGALRMSQEREAKLPWELGAHESVVVNLVTDEPRPGDVYLLCSVGLSKTLTGEQILDIVSSSAGTEGICRRLIARASENVGDDNVTVLVIAFAEQETTNGSPHPHERDREV